MHTLFLFLDGVGLGADDADVNPLARAALPTVRSLLDGHAPTASAAPFHNARATLLGLDACLGVNGLPQSATGQAALLTGRNVPALVGEHYGPKPNPPVAAVIREDNLFKRLAAAGRTAALLNAYPPRYFHGIESGRRLYSSIPLAVTSAGLPLFTIDDLYAGCALPVDFTGQGWRSMLGYTDTPLFAPEEAGRKLRELALGYDFSMFEYWPSDYAGHGQDMAKAVELLDTLDPVIGGLAEGEGDLLTVITSDHGNLEDLGTRRHTANPSLCLLLGPEQARRKFAEGLADLAGITPAILRSVL
jgi:hypothetical protein